MPVGSPCSAAECPGGKLPWDIFVNLCQAVQTQGSMTTNCVGAAVCEQWPGDSASLGQFNTVFFSDITNGVLMQGSGGTPSVGTERAFQLSILCSTSADPYPTFVSEDPISLTYSLIWNRPEACIASNPTPSPTPAKTACSICLQSIHYCQNATGSCACFSKANACFANANCDHNDVSVLKAELQCMRSGCGSGSNGNCTFV
jgi:hypothetical protein